MEEIVTNLHMHTAYSDGTGSHGDIARAAIQAGLDAVIVTDHNVLVTGPEGYYKERNKRVLLLVGEEIHNQARLPQKSHLLVFNTHRELATFADDPQHLINMVQKSGGLSFLAHPHEQSSRLINQTDITWDDWQVQGYTGIEIWNGLSEIKTVIPTILHAIFHVYCPQFIAHGATPDTLRKWDELTSGGRKVVAVGGSDAHALKVSMGPLRATVFPYTFHFSGINTHILITDKLTGNLAADRKTIFDALAAGNAFVGYDFPASTRGFRFTAQGKERMAVMGDEIGCAGGSITLQVRLPQPGNIRLIKDGKLIRSWENRQVAAHITSEPGVYRIEVRRYYLGKMRGWIYSNPIYIRPA